MIFKKIRLQNFKSFSNEQEFDFDKVNGLILVTGRNEFDELLGANGTGKSSLFSDAVTWVLFGKTSSNVRGNNIKNWASKGLCRVVLETEDKVIERTWNPNSIRVDNREISQEELENKILGMNFEVFTSSVVISQFGEKFVDLQPAKRLELITDIFSSSLLIWDLCLDKTKSLLSEEEKKAVSLEERKKGVKEQLELLRESLESFLSTKKDFEREEKKYRKRVQELEKEIALISEKMSKIEISSLEEERDRVFSLLQEKKRRATEIKTNVEIYKEQIDELLSLKATCPTCRQKVDREYIEKIVRDIEERKAEAEAILNDVLKECSLLEEQYRSIVLEINTQKDRLYKLEAELASITKELEMIQSFFERKVSYKDVIEKNKERIKDKEKELYEMDKELKENEKRIEILDFWTKGFKEIKLLMLRSFLKQLEAFSNENLAKLGLNHWSVVLDIESENRIRKGLYIKIINPFIDKEVPYECWSGGEMQRIRMAISFALAEVLRINNRINTNLMVLDEPTQHLSEEGIFHLLTFLKEKSRQYKIFYIDHRDVQNLGIFDHIVTIVRNSRGESEIELS